MKKEYQKDGESLSSSKYRVRGKETVGNLVVEKPKFIGEGEGSLKRDKR